MAQGHLLGHHEFREIKLGELFVDQRYQRELNDAAIRRYVNGFNPDLFEPVTVNERKNVTNGDPKYALLDGQHRKATAQKLGQRSLTCRVLHVDAQTEASLFVELNKNRVHLSPVAAFKAELAAKNPAAIEISKCLADRDLCVGKKDDKQSVSAVVALQKIYAHGGYVRLARVLDVALLSWPEDESHRLVGSLLLGLDDHLATARHLDVNSIAERLSKTTPDQLLARASKRWHGHRALGETSKSIVNCITEAVEIQCRKRAQTARAAA